MTKNSVSISTKSTGGKYYYIEDLENRTDNQEKSPCGWICMNVNMWAQTANIYTPVIVVIVTVAIHVNNLKSMGFFVCRLQVAFALKINYILPNNFFLDLFFDRHSEKWGDFTWVTRICIKEKWTQILVYCSFGGSSKGGGGRTDGRGEERQLLKEETLGLPGTRSVTAPLQLQTHRHRLPDLTQITVMI